MTVIDGADEAGRRFYFEVPNLLLSRRAACRVVARVPGVEILERSSSDAFCTFRLGSKSFVLWEPFGDNDRYHVGSVPPGPSPELEILREAFVRYRPVAGVFRLALMLLAMAWVFCSRGCSGG